MSTNSPKICVHVEGEHTLLEHSAGALEYDTPKTTVAPLTIKLCNEATK